MPSLSIAAHLPLLRVAEPGERMDFEAQGFALWRMPFEVFDQLSLGAFSDHRAAYEATDPLFIRLDLPLPEDQGLLRRAEAGRQTPELKLSVAHWDSGLHELGLGLLALVHTRLLDRFCDALALVAPCSLPVPARWSCSFMQAEEQHALSLAGMEAAAQLRVQGDADLEYLFRPEAANAPLPAECFAQAAALMPALQELDAQPALRAGLQALRAAATPTLRADDAELICATALEALLLPELRSGLAASFAARAAPLLGGDAGLAARLYAQRSASRHGQDAAEVLPAGLALRALAAALRGALQAVLQGKTKDPALGDWQPEPGPLPRDDGAAAAERIAPVPLRQPIASRIAPHGLRGPGDALVAVLPLVGLDCEVDARFSLGGGIVLKGLPASAVVALEDKDIARDFLSQLHLGDLRLASLQLGLAVPAWDAQQAAMQQLRRPRALAVAALRLAGFDAFIDPSLAGLHALQGLQLLRHPSVLRQTVLMRLRHAPEQAFDETGAARVRPLLDLLLRYEEAGRHADAERWLQALRRLHQRDFLPPEIRLGLGYALLEGLLGRFRDPADPQGPEQLARRLSGAAASAAWLTAEGRALRNALAHGRRLVDEEAVAALAQLQPLLHAALPLALQAWLDSPASRPARCLRRQLADTAPP